jgi:hypothetical protein
MSQLTKVQDAIGQQAGKKPDDHELSGWAEPFSADRGFIARFLERGYGSQQAYSLVKSGVPSGCPQWEFEVNWRPID